MSKQEKIVCAAVQLEVSNSGMIRKIDIPYIYTHHEIHVAELKGSIQRVINWGIESEKFGFVTNRHRFVDPVEAMKIAVEAEQLEGFLNANYWDGFKGRINDPETSCKELADEYLKRELKPKDLY